MTITRTITLNDLTPQEVAHLFAEMHDCDQAIFFAEVWRIANGWSGAGWCQQSCAIVGKLDRDGRKAIEALAAHLSSDS